MENQIDQLFKEKLEHHAHLASAEAWAKIEAALSKKNKVVVWWRLAAVFLLLGMLVSTIYWLQSTDKEYTEPTLVRKTELQAKPVEEKAERTLATKTEASKKYKSIAKRSTSHTTTSVETKTKEATEDKGRESIIELKEVAAEKTVEPVVQQSVAVAKNEKPIVLEFTLEPIETQVVVKSEEKNKGLKKVWAKAKEIKNGEGGIDLADFTSKLFALNTRHDKDNIN